MLFQESPDSLQTKDALAAFLSSLCPSAGHQASASSCVLGPTCYLVLELYLCNCRVPAP